ARIPARRGPGNRPGSQQPTVPWRAAAPPPPRFWQVRAPESSTPHAGVLVHTRTTIGTYPGARPSLLLPAQAAGSWPFAGCHAHAPVAQTILPAEDRPTPVPLLLPARGKRQHEPGA